MRYYMENMRPLNARKMSAAFLGLRLCYQSASRSFCVSSMTVDLKTTLEIFTRVSSDNSLKSLTKRSVGLVTNRPSNVYKLFVTLFE